MQRVAISNTEYIVPGHFASVKVRKGVALALSCKISSLLEFDRIQDTVRVVKRVFKRANESI